MPPRCLYNQNFKEDSLLEERKEFQIVYVRKEARTISIDGRVANFNIRFMGRSSDSSLFDLKIQMVQL